MPLPTDELQLVVLTCIANSDEPVGSLRLSQALSEQGVRIAEATAGRYLHSLQRDGYVTSLGPKKGRVITRKGRDRALLLRRRAVQIERGRKIARLSEIADIDDLIAVLHVRRGVEAEGAALAAIEADAGTASAILGEALRHAQIVREGSIPTPEESTRFHLSIAEASSNPVLLSVAQTLMDPANQRRLRSGEDVSVSLNVVAIQAAEHVAIAEAIQRGNSVEAENLMRRHLDGFIDAARGFRDRQAGIPAAFVEL
ncbi:MAG: FCD domain-containing protein [Acidipropionibacterium sp.]|jgi:DNA-binding FadR family transcriptional regulator|nr:FCD domain-containing protein [Acidipropionibacterium sp.]